MTAVLDTFIAPAMRAAALATLLCLSTPALAQVTTDEHALDTLQTAPPQAAPAAPTPARPSPTHTRHRTPSKKPAPPAKPATTARRIGPPPTIPAAPPVNPVILPPPVVLPAHPPPPPPPIPLVKDAIGIASPIPLGTRITFGPDSSDLNPATLAALQAIAAAASANPAMIVAITAWAPGTPDDPSTPRRLSLDRALAARAVLINAGIISARIRAIAKGTLDIGTAPPDRADVVEILPTHS